MKKNFFFIALLSLALLTGCHTLNTNASLVSYSYSYSQAKTPKADDYLLLPPTKQHTFEITFLDWDRLCIELEKYRYAKVYNHDDTTLYVRSSVLKRNPFEPINVADSNNFYFGGLNGIIHLVHFNTPLAQKTLQTLTNYLGPDFSNFIVQRKNLQLGDLSQTIIGDYALALECISTANGTQDYALYIIYSGVSLKNSTAQLQLQAMMGNTFQLTNVLTNGHQNILELHQPSEHLSRNTQVYYQLYQNKSLLYDQIKLIITPRNAQQLSADQLLPIEKLLDTMYPTQTIDLFSLNKQITSSIEGKLSHAKGQLYGFSYTLQQLTSGSIIVTLKNNKL